MQLSSSTSKASYLSDWVFAEDTRLTILTPADVGTDEHGAPNTLHMHRMCDNQSETMLRSATNVNLIPYHTYVIHFMCKQEIQTLSNTQCSASTQLICKHSRLKTFTWATAQLVTYLYFVFFFATHLPFIYFIYPWVLKIHSHSSHTVQ